jgi:hypothetical protein
MKAGEGIPHQTYWFDSSFPDFPGARVEEAGLAGGYGHPPFQRLVGHAFEVLREALPLSNSPRQRPEAFGNPL